MIKKLFYTCIYRKSMMFKKSIAIIIMSLCFMHNSLVKGKEKFDLLITEPSDHQIVQRTIGTTQGTVKVSGTFKNKMLPISRL